MSSPLGKLIWFIIILILIHGSFISEMLRSSVWPVQLAGAPIGGYNSTPVWQGNAELKEAALVVRDTLFSIVIVIFSGPLHPNTSHNYIHIYMHQEKWLFSCLYELVTLCFRVLITGLPFTLAHTPTINDSILHSSVPRTILKYPSSPHLGPHELAHSQ